jgi:hypothetical protein
MAKKTLANGQTQLSYYLSSASADAGRWGTDQRQAALDEAQRLVVALVPQRMLDADLVKRGSITSTGSAVLGEYKIARESDCYRLLEVMYRGTAGTSAPVPVYHVETYSDLLTKTSSLYNDTTNATRYYFEDGAWIYVAPLTTGYYQQRYIMIPTALSSSQNFMVPDHLFEWVCINAACILLMSAPDPDDNNKSKAWQEFINNRATAYRQLWNMEPPSMYGISTVTGASVRSGTTTPQTVPGGGNT